jgi:alkanesulfonate monooxygenase SsuD/methylene tetrahydromethanopterin reductase-like flavin-dependent oxidoreductase (luciferase family)
MNDLQFGVFLNPSRDRAAPVVASARAAEAAGFDYVSIQDHPYEGQFLDPLALIGVLMGATGRIRFMTNVANLPLRPPATLAKSAASLDVLSGGRFELGDRGYRRDTGLRCERLPGHRSARPAGQSRTSLG